MEKLSENEQKYSDIINMEHHVSKTHIPMSMRDRAAQFSPFAALSGYEDALSQTAAQSTREALMDIEHCDVDESEALRASLDQQI